MVIRSSEPDGGTREEGHALSLSPCPPVVPSIFLSLFFPIYLFPRFADTDTTLPQSRTDGQNLNDSAFVQDRREAVRKIALSMMNSVRSARLRGPPRPPIGRERRDRERYRHEGTNYPPTIATTIRTRPPPPSATTPRFGVRDEEGRAETEPPGRGRRDVEGPGWKGRNSGGRERRERERQKNARRGRRPLLHLSFPSLFLPPRDPSSLSCRRR